MTFKPGDKALYSLLGSGTNERVVTIVETPEFAQDWEPALLEDITWFDHKGRSVWAYTTCFRKIEQGLMNVNQVIEMAKSLRSALLELTSVDNDTEAAAYIEDACYFSGDILDMLSEVVRIKNESKED